MALFGLFQGSEFVSLCQLFDLARVDQALAIVVSSFVLELSFLDKLVLSGFGLENVGLLSQTLVKWNLASILSFEGPLGFLKFTVFKFFASIHLIVLYFLQLGLVQADLLQLVHQNNLFRVYEV